ncbi:MAG: ABC transporter permease subunit [Lachnospiraceae bacterium]|nr:ABC transporter permease subunit [Lachnospiraceae bacterium]
MYIILGLTDAVYSNLISGGAYFRIIKALAVTVLITVAAWIIAMILGMIISYMTCYEKKIISGLGRALCFILRSVPVLLTIWLFYYVPAFGINLPAVVASSLAIGLYGAGSFSEILTRSAKREMENYSDNIKEILSHSHFTAVIPEAIENSLFEIKRLTILLMSLSSLAGYIGTGELVNVMSTIGHRNMYPFFSIFFCMVIYLIAAAIIEAIFNKLIVRVKKRKEKEEQQEAEESAGTSETTGAPAEESPEEKKN